jgi:hypothetical protein
LLSIARFSNGPSFWLIRENRQQKIIGAERLKNYMAHPNALMSIF